MTLSELDSRFSEKGFSLQSIALKTIGIFGAVFWMKMVILKIKTVKMEIE